MEGKTIRPTKKQRELLTFIERFIGEHGYSPSYREIMSGLNYTSVATVALHINSLIKRGHLRKRDYSARSLELTHATGASVKTNQVSEGQEKWLVDRVEHAFLQVEQAPGLIPESLQGLRILVTALRVLGMEAAAQSFTPRLSGLERLARTNRSV